MAVNLNVIVRNKVIPDKIVRTFYYNNITERDGITAKFYGRLGNHMFIYGYARLMAESNNCAWDFRSNLLRNNFPTLPLCLGSSIKYNVINRSNRHCQDKVHIDLLNSNIDKLRSWFVPSTSGIKFLESMGWPDVIHVRGTDFKKHDRYINNCFYDKVIGMLDNPIIITDDSKFAKKVIPNVRVFSSDDDFSIMYYARTLVLSRSTFCWWAGFLGQHDRVISPVGWFNDDDGTYPFEWSVENLRHEVING